MLVHTVEMQTSDRFVEAEEACPICGGACLPEWEECADESDYEQDGCRA